MCHGHSLSYLTCPLFKMEKRSFFLSRVKNSMSIVNDYFSKKLDKNSKAIVHKKQALNCKP